MMRTGDDPVGYITKNLSEDMRMPASSGSGSPANVPVTAGDVMTSPVITVAPVSPLPYAIGLMQSEQVNNLVVVEDNTLAGIVRRDDIIKEVAK